MCWVCVLAGEAGGYTPALHDQHQHGLVGSHCCATVSWEMGADRGRTVLLVDNRTEKPGAILTQVRFSDAARLFFCFCFCFLSVILSVQTVTVFA